MDNDISREVRMKRPTAVRRGTGPKYSSGSQRGGKGLTYVGCNVHYCFLGVKGGRHRCIPTTVRKRCLLARERIGDVLSTPSSEGRRDREPRVAQVDIGCWLLDRENYCLPAPALHAEWTAAMQKTKEFYSENMMVFIASAPPAALS